MNTGRWIVGLTGASGMRYGLRLLQVLAPKVSELHVILSDAARRVLAEEEGLRVGSSGEKLLTHLDIAASSVHFHNVDDIGASIASGSFRVDGMVVVPCSMGTLAAISHGLSSNLIQRAAEVMLKERRPLILVPRETPLSEIALRNMLRLSEAGAVLLPAMPGFYHRPATIDDLVNMLVMKIVDQMGLQIDLVERWKESSVSVGGAAVASNHPGSCRILELKQDRKDG